MSTPSTAAPAVAAAARAEPAALSGRRRAVVWTLVILASLIGFVSILTTWVNRQLLDNNSWQKASTQVIQDPKVQSAVSLYLVNQLYASVNVEAALQKRLPPSLQGLAGPLAGALQQPATDTVKLLLGRPRGQQLFVAASTAAHQQFVNVVENKTGAGISTGHGDVTLDLSQLLKELGAELGLPAGVLAKIAANTGVITVMRSDQLSEVQTGVRAVRILSVWLLVLVLVMYGAAIYLARGIRRETLRNIGWSFVIVGLLILIVRRVAGNYAVDSLTSATYRPSARDVFLIGSSILGQVGKATIFYGLVAVVGAVLAGPTRLATKARGFLAPTLNEHQGIAWFAAGIVYLVLVFWGPTHALRTYWGVLLLGALLALGLWAFRRETLREFPADPPSKPIAAS
jgi:hypothetical protein